MKFLRLGIIPRLMISASFALSLLLIFMMNNWDSFESSWQAENRNNELRPQQCENIRKGLLPDSDIDCKSVDTLTPAPYINPFFSITWGDSRSICDMYHRGATDELLNKYKCDIPIEHKSLLTYVLDNKVSEFKMDFFITGLGLFILLTTINLYLKQQSTGWKRLSVIVSIAITALVALTYNGNIFLILVTLITFTLSMLAMLLGNSLFYWVKEGFNSDQGKSIPIQSESKVETTTSFSAPQTSSQEDEAIAETQEQRSANDLKSPSYWDRFWARGIDLAIVYFVGSVIFALFPTLTIFSEQYANLLFQQLVWMMLLCIFIITYDYLLLSNFSTTTGKALFAIKVLSKNGNKLSSFEAYERTLRLLGYGLSYMLFFPFIQVFNANQAYIYLKNNNTTKWDSYFFQVKQKPIGFLRRIVCSGIGIMAIFAIIAVQQYAKHELQKQTEQAITQEYAPNK